MVARKTWSREPFQLNIPGIPNAAYWRGKSARCALLKILLIWLKKPFGNLRVSSEFSSTTIYS